MVVVVEVEVARRGRYTVVIERGEKVGDVISRLGLNPLEYLAVVNNRLMPLDEPVSEPIKLKLIPVVSGG